MVGNRGSSVSERRWAKENQVELGSLVAASSSSSDEDEEDGASTGASWVLSFEAPSR